MRAGVCHVRYVWKVETSSWQSQSWISKFGLERERGQKRAREQFTNNTTATLILISYDVHVRI